MDLKENKSLILISTTLIVLLVIVIFVSYKFNKTGNESVSVPPDIKTIQTQANSDEISSIENDIDAVLNSAI
jgi:hypothetical protein